MQDLAGSILKIAKFLEKTLTEEQIRDLTEHLSFANMKRNPAVNGEAESGFWTAYAQRKQEPEIPFMRRGQTGQWNDIMSEAMVQRFQKWEEEYLENTDYPLVLDL